MTTLVWWEWLPLVALALFGGVAFFRYLLLDWSVAFFGSPEPSVEDAKSTFGKASWIFLIVVAFLLWRHLT